MLCTRMVRLVYYCIVYIGWFLTLHTLAFQISILDMSSLSGGNVLV